MGAPHMPHRGSGGEDQLLTAFDVKDTPQAFVFHADVPGLKEKDLEVQINGNRLTIRGKREAEREEPGHTYYAYERSYGSFARTFTLPESADVQKCGADLKDGVLTVTVPKKASEQPRTVAVNQKPQSEKS
ncbi:MAG TPA: HSP20 family small heat-shock protein [Polyangiaceae bacterium]